MLTIVDYRLGNLGSIRNMLRKLGFASEITSDPEALGESSGVILPGVGAFDNGMRNLRELGLIEPLNRLVLDRGIPILGICLGAQLMAQGSDEGTEVGLGWVRATNVRFDRARAPGIRIPAMGWGDVHPRRPHWILRDLPPDPRFYFVHSFHFRVENPEDVLLTATYGYDFAAAFATEEIVGVQFHPEKSHKFGMGLLGNFARHVSGRSRAST